jgi:hypothetical protein
MECPEEGIGVFVPSRKDVKRFPEDVKDDSPR